MLEEILKEKSWLEQIAESRLPVAVYGMGNGADKLFAFLEQQGLRPACVFASDEFVRGQSFRGYPVLRYRQAAEQYGEMNILLAFATDLPPVMARIREIAEQMPLFCPSFSVARENCATRQFLEAHAPQIEQAYAALADEDSRKTFRGVAEFQLTGRLPALDAISQPRSQSLALLHLSSEEIYADLGAYRGDTLLEFLEQAGDYRQIFAVEPDAKNFAKLESLIRRLNLRGVVAKNNAVSDAARKVCFGSPGGRSSAIGRGKGEVQALPLLELTHGQIPSYIKMDIEGAEAAALRGMEGVLAAHAPKLLVSAYHRIEDYFSLPLQILRAQPGYRIYLRKSPYYPAWEVNLICLAQ